MGLASLITIPLGILFFAAMMRGYGPRMENYMRSANDMNSFLVEYVNGIQVIKAFNRSASSYWKILGIYQLFSRFHNGVVEPMLVLERRSESRSFPLLFWVHCQLAHGSTWRERFHFPYF